MEDRLKEMKETSILNKIHFDQADQNRVFNKISSSHPAKQPRWFMGILGAVLCLGVLAFVLFQVVPNTLFQHNNSTVPTTSENIKTIKTYYKKEFTGPNVQLKRAFEQFYNQGNGSELDDYLNKNYKPLIAENQFETFVNANMILGWQREAYSYGYQLKPKSINIQKADKRYEAYNCKVVVEFSKNGVAKTATVTEYINMNDKGKISAIRDINDRELLKNLLPPPPKDN